MNSRLQGIDTVIVRVKDISRSRKWYTQSLGLTVEFEDLIHKLVVLNTGGPTSLTIWQTDGEVITSRQGSTYPIFKTAAAEETRSALVANGVMADPVITDHAVTYFHFYDPDGNMIEACQVH